MNNSNGQKEKRWYLQRMVKTYYDLQKIQTTLMNRCGLKKDKKQQNRITVMSETEIAFYQGLLQETANRMDELEKNIKAILQEFPIWTEWLQAQIGVGWTLGAVIISVVDIYEAITPSKICAHIGIAHGEVLGQKYSKKKGEWYKTKTLIPRDRQTKGFRSPYNDWAKTKFMKVLCDNFLRSEVVAKRRVYTPFYYDVKHRRESAGWGANKMQRDLDARRHMLQHFIQDLYANWRELEGLPVRKPYSEEYLGKTHDAA